MSTMWIEMCSGCKRGEPWNTFDCTCHTAVFDKVEATPEPEIREMGPFTLLQLDRDRTDRAHDLPGDWCKRYVTCTRCQWTSDPVGFWSEMDTVEDDHMLHGCPAPAPGWSPDNDPIWPSRPLPWVFTYRIEPADEPTGRGIDRSYGTSAGRRAPTVLHLPKRTEPAESEAA